MASRTPSLVLTLAALLWIAPCHAQDSGPAQRTRSDPLDALHARVHEHPAGKLPYRIYVPTAHAKSGGRYPLVLFLHGAGERGDDNAAQLRHGVARFVAASAQAERPCFLIAPQCKAGVWWHDGETLAICRDLIRSTMRRYPIDRDRIYVTGLSMGGYGTWRMLADDPELFAAAVPICGGGDPASAERFEQVPVWAFHGDIDPVVAVKRSREMVEAMRKAGGAPRYTEYADVQHDSWSRTYADPAVHEWLFAQRRGSAPLVAGERIVCFGDSITESGVSDDGYVTLIAERLAAEHPDHGIEVIGAGVSGNRVPDLLARFEKAVVAAKPTRVVIYIGINDVWHWKRESGTDAAAFESGLRELVARTRALGARVVLCTPSVIGEHVERSNEFDAMLNDYAHITRRVAAESDAGVTLVDLRARFCDYLTTTNHDDVDRGVLTTDGVHLNPAGNRFVAARILEGLR